MRRRAFSLIELLVVIAIIGVLLGILLPALSKVRDAKQASGCLANLHSIGQAMAKYAHRSKDLLPSYGTWDGVNNPVTWNTALLKDFNEVTNKVIGDDHVACPAYEPKLTAGGENPSTYGLNYPGVFGYAPAASGTPVPNPPPSQRGSARFYKVPPTVFLVTDQQQPVELPNPTSVIFSPAPGGWPLTDDRDGDGVNDTNAAFTPPARDVPYNGLDPRHPRHGANFLFADGSARSVKLGDWLANSGNLWGAADNSYR